MQKIQITLTEDVIKKLEKNPLGYTVPEYVKLLIGIECLRLSRIDVTPDIKKALKQKINQ